MKNQSILSIVLKMSAIMLGICFLSFCAKEDPLAENFLSPVFVLAEPVNQMTGSIALKCSIEIRGTTPSSYGFHYGTNKDLTDKKEIPAQLTEEKDYFYAEISDVALSTKYYYRAYIGNKTSDIFTDIGEFTTPDMLFPIEIEGSTWAAMNATGEGGYSQGGNWYYTHTQAMSVCPDDWRLPTRIEFGVLMNLGSTWKEKGPNTTPGGKAGRWFGSNHAEATASNPGEAIFLPASGYMNENIGGLNHADLYGGYWSNMSISENALYLRFTDNNVRTEYNGKDDGRSVRCVKGLLSNLLAVTTEDITNISTITATFEGEVTSEGESEVIEQGFVYSTTNNPPSLGDASNTIKITSVIGIGEFTSNITALTASTKYHVRAYAINANTTSYGEPLSFTTLGMTEKEALVALYNASGGASWVNSNNWNTDTPLDEWFGITMEDGHVTEIELRNNKLKGVIPPSIGNLKQLQVLDVGNGEKTRSSNIEKASTANQLTALDISGNTALTHLDCAYNLISILDVSKNTALTFLSCINNNITILDIKNILDLSDLLCGNQKGNKSLALYLAASQEENWTNTWSIDGANLAVTSNTGDSEAAWPVLTTRTITSIGVLGAISGGNITSDGGHSITSKGVVWNTSSDPTIALATKTTDGAGTEEFTSTITGLTANTTYYVRAYATSAIGTSYGENQMFKTLNIPNVITKEVTDILATTAKFAGEVISDGGKAITERGFVYSKINTTPKIDDVSNTTKFPSTLSPGIGKYEGNITGLVTGSKYYIRAYATTSNGTSYGDVKTFTTLNVPSVITNDATDILASTAKLEGKVTSDGGQAVSERGFVYSKTNATPKIDDVSNTQKLSSGIGTGSYFGSATGLISETKYYVRAYAINSAGTSYGEVKTFTTKTIGANSYMLRARTSVTIPVLRVNEARPGAITSSTSWTLELVDIGDGTTAIATLGSNSGSGITSFSVRAVSNGNVAVALKIGGTVRWVWHIWVTSYQPNDGISYNGLHWMDRNLGASGSGWTGIASYGLTYQWGKNGPYSSNSTTVPKPLWQTFYNSIYESGLSIDAEWGNAAGAASVKSIHDPCPNGWRVPRKDPWKQEGIANVNGYSVGGLFFPHTGSRNSSGVPAGVGVNGNYWASALSPSGNNAYFMNFTHTIFTPSGYTNRNNGFSVRCVRIDENAPGDIENPSGGDWN